MPRQDLLSNLQTPAKRGKVRRILAGKPRNDYGFTTNEAGKNGAVKSPVRVGCKFNDSKEYR